MTSACDALPDNTCPSAELCNKDSGIVSLGEAQLAKDDDVAKFWEQRDEFFEKIREREKANKVDRVGEPGTGNLIRGAAVEK